MQHNMLKLTPMLLLNLATTLFMTGLIWFVQVVHYPLFNTVGPDKFISYTSRHSNLTTLLVGPVMLLELLGAVSLIWHPPARLAIWQCYLGLGLLGLIWVSTAFIQVPQHSILAQGFNQQAYQLLVKTNWVRTLAWTLRSFLVCYWMSLHL